MAGITITVAEMRQPAPGKKQWSLIDTSPEKRRWGVEPEDAQKFTVGRSYTIDKYATNDYRGKRYYTIEESTPLMTDRNTQAAQQWPDKLAMPQPISIPQSLTLKDEVIFVAGQMNNAMANPSVNPFAITTVERIKFINDCRTAWRNTFGKVQSDDEMSDSIPF